MWKCRDCKFEGTHWDLMEHLEKVPHSGADQVVPEKSDR